MSPTESKLCLVSIIEDIWPKLALFSQRQDIYFVQLQSQFEEKTEGERLLDLLKALRMFKAKLDELGFPSMAA